MWIFTKEIFLHWTNSKKNIIKNNKYSNKNIVWMEYTNTLITLSACVSDCPNEWVATGEANRGGRSIGLEIKWTRIYISWCCSSAQCAYDLFVLILIKQQDCCAFLISLLPFCWSSTYACTYCHTSLPIDF